MLRNVPIRQKLMLIAMLTTGGALLLAGAALIYFDRVRFMREMAGDLETLADIVAQNSTAALSFQNPDDATETLEGLKPRRSIVAAAVYDSGGRLFAHYDPAGKESFPLRPGEDGAEFVDEALDEALVVFRPVELQGQRIGTVYLRSNLDALTGRFKAQAAMVGSVFLASGLVALLLSSRLQRVVSRPILALAETARTVSERKDYSIRAEKRGSDELSRLVDAFNEMLVQIQERDSELQRAKEELEQRVRERTRELQQELAERQRAERELERRNEELHQSNKELDDFAYIASHDLKEPLRGIHNFSSFLIEDYSDKLDEEGRSKLETLMRLTHRMETLIDSLLHFSRLGRVDLAIDQVDLNGIVAEVLDSLAITLGETGTEVKIPKPLPTVRADRARVGEIFYNLVVNALKYNDKPEKWIEIGAFQDGDGRPPVFYIRDNGIGIPEKHHDSVFRIFKRLHGRDKFGGGTGAGLTIVKKIVERHHGRIWLESSAGEGTTFYFTLQEGDVRA
jgi:signal transduction histidine kinase